MTVKYMPLVGVLFVSMLTWSQPSFAEGPASIQLPNPQREGGKPLMSALNERMSGRSFSNEKLSMQTLSNLLWAAFGINRPDGRRTAPSAKNSQEIEIYVTTADGAYLYDAKMNALNPILTKDIRAVTGTDPYVKNAAVNLVYVSDSSRVGSEGGAEGNLPGMQLLSGADTGVIAENVYLFCASEGLATVVRAGIDREALAKELKLRPQQKITFAQSVGYPKKQ